MGQLVDVATQLAKSPQLSKTLKQGVSQDDAKELVETLTSVVDHYGFIDASLIQLSTDKYWNQDGFLKTLDETDTWYHGQKNKFDGVKVSTFRELDGVFKMFVNYQDVDAGILAATSKDMDEVENFLQSFSLTENTNVFLVDRTGLIKSHTSGELVGRGNFFDLYGVKEMPHAHKVSVESRIKAGKDVIVATSYVASLDWFIVIEIPRHEAFASLEQTKKTILLSIAAIAFAVVVASWFLANSIVRPIEEISAVFKDIGQGDGDLRTRIPVTGNDEITELSIGFNSFIGKIHSSVQSVAETSFALREAAELVDGYSTKTLNLCDHQSDITIHAVTSINELGATVSDIAQNAALAAQQASEADLHSKEGENVVIQTKDVIEQLSNDIEGVAEVMVSLAGNTNSIEKILDVIRDISGQTNLLALNAAIEAARAGEHGRGFAVVADEVRMLAQKTNDSIDDIQKMIASLQKEATSAVDSIEVSKGFTEQSSEHSEQARKAISVVAVGIGEITGVSHQVATATEEQATVVEDLNIKVEEINQVTLENRETASNMAESSLNLKGLSKKLDGLVSEFKL